MKLRSLPLVLALAAGAVASAPATTVTLSSSPTSRSVFDSALIALANGDLVLIGTFQNPRVLEIAPVVDLQAEAGWTQFGSALSVTSIFGNPGKLTGTSSDTTGSAGFFNGRQIYLWVFDAPTIEQATGWGIFTSAGGSTAWLFPANNGGVGDLVTLQIDEPSLSAVNGLGVVGESQIQLVHAVPEPGTWALLALAAVFAALRVPHRFPARLSPDDITDP